MPPRIRLVVAVFFWSRMIHYDNNSLKCKNHLLFTYSQNRLMNFKVCIPSLRTVHGRRDRSACIGQKDHFLVFVANSYCFCKAISIPLTCGSTRGCKVDVGLLLLHRQVRRIKVEACNNVLNSSIIFNSFLSFPDSLL